MESVEFKGKTILAVGAHPDDNDFAYGGTMAKAVDQGAAVFYLVATGGERGSNNPHLTGDKLGVIRRAEQRKAAAILGVREVSFLDYCDGELIADLGLKEKIVRAIRGHLPDMVFTLDPSFFYYKESGMVNHSDHRAVGEATLDACYPLARDLLSFPEHADEGLPPHRVSELFLHSFSVEGANCRVDISDQFERKVQAIGEHGSQVGDIADVAAFMETRARRIGQQAGCLYAEAFVRLKLPG